MTESADKKIFDKRIYEATLGYINDVLTILKTDYTVGVKPNESEIGKFEKYEKQQVEINNKYQIAASKWVSKANLFPAFQQFETDHGIPNFEGAPILYRYTLKKE